MPESNEIDSEAINDLHYELSNFRGLPGTHTASFMNRDECNHTTIAGDNEAGKSCFINGLQAIVTGESMCLKGLPVKDVKILVATGEKSASASLKWRDEFGNEQLSTIKWPSRKMTGIDAPFMSSEYAAGVKRATEIEAKKLSEILGILPTAEEFGAAMAEYPCMEDATPAVWDRISKMGWDAALATVKTKRTDLSSQWAKLAGEDYGSKKMLGDATKEPWKPMYYDPRPLEELELSLTAAQALLDNAVNYKAVNSAQQADLKKLAESAPIAQTALEIANSELAAAAAELTKASVQLTQIPKILNTKKAYSCWKCGELGCLDGEKMVQPPDSTSVEEAAQIRVKVEEQEKLIRQLQDDRDQKQNKAYDAKKLLEKCQQAEKQLSAVQIDVPEPGIGVDEAKQDVWMCKQRIDAHHKLIKCDEIDQDLRANDYIISLLKPEGLRQQVLSTKLADFHELLDKITGLAGWGQIRFDETLNVYYDEKPFIILSESRQYAVNAALQIALARKDNSKLIIMDGLQVLEERLREGLFKVLEVSPIPSVIACSFDSKADLALSKINYGCVYWINKDHKIERFFAEVKV